MQLLLAETILNYFFKNNIFEIKFNFEKTPWLLVIKDFTSFWSGKIGVGISNLKNCSISSSRNLFIFGFSVFRKSYAFIYYQDVFTLVTFVLSEQTFTFTPRLSGSDIVYDNIFDVRKFSVSRNFSIWKIDGRIYLTIITKNSAADPEIRLYVLVSLSGSIRDWRQRGSDSQLCF